MEIRSGSMPETGKWGKKRRGRKERRRSARTGVEPFGSTAATPGRRSAGVGRTLAILLLAAGCVAAGGAIGWWVRDGQKDAVAPLVIDVTIDRPVVLQTTSNAALGQMPSVLGLSLVEARRVLFDAGVAADAITVTERPTALDKGIIVLQEPLAGSPLRDVVSLVVSKEAVVPELVGLPLSEAEALLKELGSNPTVQRRRGADGEPDIVLGSTPPAGAPLERSILLSVSSP